MKTTRKTDKNGVTTSHNFMLDEIIDLFEIRGINNGANEELIKKLAIEKMRYGIYCAFQVASANDPIKEAQKLKISIEEQINKLLGA